MPDFANIVEHLDNPYALIGYALCLFFGLLSAVLKKGGGVNVALLMRYSFLLTVLVIVGGFTLLIVSEVNERDALAAVVSKSARSDQWRAPEADRTVAKSEIDRAISQLQRRRARAKDDAEQVMREVFAGLAEGDTGRAVEVLEEAVGTLLSEAEEADTPSQAEAKRAEAAEAARALGALSFLSHTQTAVAAYRRAVELDPASWQPWQQLALLYVRTGDYAEAVQAAQRVIGISESTGDKAALAAASGVLGVVARQRSELDDAAAYHREAAELYEQVDEDAGLAVELGNLGIVKRMSGALDEAEALHTRALDIEKRLQQPIGIAREYGNLGLLNVVRGKEHWTDAENYLRLSLNYNRDAGSLVGEGIRENDLGDAALRRRAYEEAEKRFRRSLQIAEQLENLYGKALAKSDLGRVEKFRGQYGGGADHFAKADRLYNEALNLFERLGNPLGKSMVYARMGRLHRRWGRDGDLESADEYYEKALRISRNRGHRRATVDYLRYHALILYELGRQDDACGKWREGLDLSIKIDLSIAAQQRFRDKIRDAGCPT